jgi:ribonuclease E
VRAAATASGGLAATATPVATRDAEPAGMETIDLGDEEGAGEAEGLSPMATVAETPVETPAVEETSEEDPYDDSVEVLEKDETIETVAEEEDPLEMRTRAKPQRARRYKIQEVVKVRQIMLVQVVKEERGNKGAALTTYLSLAGRYCVLMPNTARGGGISRKITNAADRKKLKDIAGEMEVPEGAGLIIRTAGSQRTMAEIKRDYEYPPAPLGADPRAARSSPSRPPRSTRKATSSSGRSATFTPRRSTRSSSRGRGLPQRPRLHEDDHAGARAERRASP